MIKRLVSIALLLSIPNLAMAADFSAWSNYKVITIDNTNVDSDLTDFPLLVDIDADTDIGATAQADCDDIRFVADDGTTQLPHDEIECAESGGAITAWYRVKVPTVNSASTTDIRIYYGNGAAADGSDEESVYGANAEIIYDLTETSSTTADHYKDSSANNNHGTSDSTRNPAQVSTNCTYSNCADFTADSIEPKTNLHMTGDWTAIITAYPDTLGAGRAAIGNDLGGWNDDIMMGIDPGTLTTDDYWGANHQNNSPTGHVTVESTTIGSTTGGMEVVAWRATSGTLYQFVDGAQEDSAACNSGDCTWGNNALAIGSSKQDDHTRAFYGLMQDVFIYSDSKSNAWLKFYARNVKEADNEISFGSEQSNSGGAARRVVFVT